MTVARDPAGQLTVSGGSMHARLTVTLAFALVASRVDAQIPEKFENLQIFPKDVARGELVQRMREFSFALGVRCEHCHVEPATDLANRFASDAKSTKVQARAMLKMVASINGTLLPQLPSHASPAVQVDCVTCHRGLPIPKTLQTTLLEVATAEGGAAAAARYRELRKTNLTTGRYNFGEWEINELARRLAQSGNLDAAVIMLDANAEFYPASADIDVLLGELHLKRGQKDLALARFRAALTKAPDHERAKLRLQELEAKP
jgi:tetratricopeptide (TPR) repeat protein